MQERVTELEIKFTYLEDTVDKLNQVVIRQQEEIERLERRLAELEERRWTGTGYDPSTPQGPPPHY